MTKKPKKVTAFYAGNRPQNKKLFFALVSLFILLVMLAFYYFAQSLTGEFDYESFFIGLAVGFIAQLVDGAVGMAYGVTSSSFLLAFGASPLVTTASVHIAEIFTTGASGLSHWWHGNVNKKLFRSMLIGGVLGAVTGALTVFSLDGGVLRPYVSAYLILMGCFIVARALRSKVFAMGREIKNMPLLALIGGYVDSIGGGGWGPMMTTTILSKGNEPRTTIGSVNSAEFFVTLASGLTFATIAGLGYYETVMGLILGGMLISPFAAKLVQIIPARQLLLFVGIFIILLSGYNLMKSLG